MQLGESLSVLGDFFRLTYITNTGAAFSFSLGNDEINRLFFIVVSIVAILVFLFLLIKERRLITRIAYALILGGAFGNLIDRILYGAVIDFFDFKFFSFIMERWPVFNIADSAIVIAIFLLLFDLIVAPKDEKPGEGTENNFQTIEESL
jgi:signal peptidase II